MLTCDVCGKLHPAGTAVCDVCGSPLTASPYLPSSALSAEIGLDRLPANSELGRVLAEPLRELTGALCPFCDGANRPGATFCTHCGHALVASPSGPLTPDDIGRLEPGALLQGRYRVIRRVAQGGMGAVYEAHDEQAPGGLRLALKEMVQSSVAPEERTQALKDFMREATLLATLQHPTLPEFHGVFSQDGKHYLVMEFVQGQTLEHVVSVATGFLPEARVLTWAAQLCDALAYLHGQDPPIIYRDMKPGNIMLVDGADRVKLIDFGIARFHREGRPSDTAAFGTAGYAPPEQYGAGQTDQRSDVYALAATLHHLLSGHDPVQNPFHWRPIRSFNPHVSRQVDQAIMRALELKQELRFAGIDPFAQALGLRPAPAIVAAAASAPTPALSTAAAPPSAPPTTRVSQRDLRLPAEDGRRDGARRPQRREGPTLPPLVPAAPPVPALAVAASAGPLLSLSETAIDLAAPGLRPRGHKITFANAGQGQLKGLVHVNQPWLAVSAVQFQGNVGEVTVSVRRAGLRFGQSDPPTPSVLRGVRAALGTLVGRWALIALLAVAIWVGSRLALDPVTSLEAAAVGLLGLLAAAQIALWLVARHVRLFVPAPLLNRGEVVIDSNGGQRRVEVRTLARPSWLRRGTIWICMSALLVAEFVAFILLALRLALPGAW
jgi:serine/threonine protein kinase, bacterial